jgi:hypothetical protein
MPELTRRRSPDAPEECWHIYWGDIHAGTIAKRIGIPLHEDPWGWSCGFYPGSHPGEHTDGLVGDPINKKRRHSVTLCQSPRATVHSYAINLVGHAADLDDI